MPERPVIDGLVLTEHAQERFEERFEYVHKRRHRNPLYAIRAYLKEAREAKMPAKYRLKRLLSNEFKQAKFLENESGWRFVVVDGSIVTIERTDPLQN